MDLVLIILLFVILVVVAWALFGKGEAHESGDEPTPPELLYRRRASDQEIEEKYPSRQDAPRRRKSDAPESEAEEAEETLDEDFKLPYSADEIISDSSRFRIYKRTIVNSEIYAKKGDFETAISLYEGVNSRINDQNTTDKINANIHYLRNYKAFRDQVKKEEQSLARQMKPKKGSEIRLSVDGPLSIPDRINIGLNVPPPVIEQPPLNIDSIVEKITRKMLESRLTETRREQEIQKHLREIENLKSNIQKLSKKEQEPERAALDEEIERKTRKLDEKIAEIARLKEQLEKIENQVDRLREESRKPPIPHSEEKPAIIQARYESPVPVTIDPRPILEILEKMPRREVPPPKPVEPPKPPEPEQVPEEQTPELEHMPEEHVPDQEQEPIAETEEPAADEEAEITSAPEEPVGEPVVQPEEENEIEPEIIETPPPPQPVTETPDKKKEEVEKDVLTSQKEREEPEDFELLSQYGKEHDYEELTDEDIFAKILQDDNKGKIADSLEIIGDRKRDLDNAYGITDAELDSKRKEEEEFYEKFLKHERRIRKELPILKVTYDFSKLPDDFSLSRDKNILEYSFYKYKPLLEKANGFIKTRRVRDALNYYKMVMNQNIPPEFKVMIRKNISDLTEYLEKYLTGD
jgi:hypothetical protein